MRSLACVKLFVTAEGKLQVQTDAHLEVHPNAAGSELFVKAGMGKIRVVKTAGLRVPQEGARFNRFVPMFDLHGVFQGLAIGETATSNHTERSSLLVVVGIDDAALRRSPIHSTHLFCGSWIYGDTGRIEAFVTVLDPTHQLTVDTGRTIQRFCNREGMFLQCD